MEDLFKNKEWIGEFFSDDYENRFFGKLKYSPEEGLILQYRIAGINTVKESAVLYGIIDNGKKCTLVGNFKPNLSGISFQDGFTSRHGKNGFSYLVMGEFIKKDSIFKEVIFDLIGMQEFFFPKGYKDLVKFVEKPIFKVKAPYGKIEIGNSATFNSLSSKDITSLIFSRNRKALGALKKSFNEIGELYPDSYFMLKKDISYYVRLTFNKAKNVRVLFDHIREMADLFAILTYSPVYPKSINLIANDKKKKPYQLAIYPSMAIGRRTINIATREKSHFHMPITKSNIDLPKTIESWMTNSNKFASIISSIQNETGFRDEHAIHGEIVLYATQLESISHSQKIKNNDKYEHPINLYGSSKVIDGLKHIFKQINNESLGKNIGNLRNEIAHIGKPNKLLKSLSLQQKVFIGQYLQVILISFIFSKLGINLEAIEKYQHEFTPDKAANNSVE